MSLQALQPFAPAGATAGDTPSTPPCSNDSVQLFQPAPKNASRCVHTTCPYCGTGCGISVQVSETSSQYSEACAPQLTLGGDTTHPTNHGKLCSKGSNLLETLDLNARLLHPELNGQRVDWDTALASAASQIRTIIDQHGPDAFAIYCSGQLLTEDYYVANKLMKGFIGSANIDTNSRLCMSSAVAGHKRAFGADAVPACYEDLDLAELAVVTGSNMAWCHPILFQRIKKAKAVNPAHKLVVIDPRRTASCDDADLHLALKPGSDAVLFNGLLVYLADRVKLDYDFIDDHTEGFGTALTVARASAPDVASVATACELDPADVETFYRWFMATPRTVTCFSQGINQSSSGTDKVNAILNLHLATGRIGKPGAAPFSLTGQPNAMGGREVGGLANQLAAHLELDNPAHRELVGRFWGSERVADQPGLKAVELFRAIEAGHVKGVWIMATNPVDSLPDADRVRAALAGCELVILSDCMAATDTAPYAQIRFPATGWGEKDGTVTNAERCISRQRALLPPSGEAKPDWWIISQIAQRLGYREAFDYQAPWQIFQEHARLSAFENYAGATPRDFDLSAWSALDADGYAALQPTQWPVNAANPEGCSRLFENGRFYTANGKARLLPITPRGPVNTPDEAYPLLLNTGRIRDQWHTMTRTGLSPRLAANQPEPFVQIHPTDAARQGLAHGVLARINSRWGEMLARVQVTDSVNPSQLFVPMHWTSQFASQGRMGPLVNPEVDPLSGQPESKQTPVKIEPLAAAWYGFLLSRNGITADCTYRVRVSGEQHTRLELADRNAITNWRAQAQEWLGHDGEWIEYSDPANGNYRCARIENGQLQAVLMIATTPSLPERDWLGSLFAKQHLSDDERRLLLSGRAPVGASAGPTVCACFGVGRNTISDAIRNQGLDSVAAIGRILK
ncbi:MAG TPA: molybdopterin-dependent oxidoreductase, partial [Motiliproteus sp.]